METRAHEYVIDPAALKQLVTGHIRWFWKNHLQAEWNRVRPMLEESARAFNQIDFSGLLSELTISSRERLIKDLGFMAINLFGVAIAGSHQLHAPKGGVAVSASLAVTAQLPTGGRQAELIAMQQRAVSPCRSEMHKADRLFSRTTARPGDAGRSPRARRQPAR